MTKEWFTLPELKALGIAYFTEAKLERLAYDFPALRTQARVRIVQAGTIISLYEPEYIITLFPPAVIAEIVGKCGTDGHTARLFKLGIHRPVAHPRGRYVGPDVDAEIAALEGALRTVKGRRAA